MPPFARSRGNGRDATGKCLGLFNRISIASLSPRRERPRHAVGAVEQRSDSGMLQRCLFEAKSMQPKVRSHALDGDQNRQHALRSPIALAYRPDAYPHSGLQPVAVRANVSSVICRRVALEHRQDRKRQILADQGVVTLDCQTLVIINRQTSLSEHEGFAHEILCNRRDDLNNARDVKAQQFIGVCLRLVPIAAMLRDFGKGSAIDQNFVAIDWLFAAAQHIYAETGPHKMARIAGVMQADKKQRSRISHALSLTFDAFAVVSLQVWSAASDDRPRQSSPSRPRPSGLPAFLSCGQRLVSQPLSGDADDETVQPRKCMVLDVALVQPERELVNVAADRANRSRRRASASRP